MKQENNTLRKFNKIYHENAKRYMMEQQQMTKKQHKI